MNIADIIASIVTNILRNTCLWTVVVNYILAATIKIFTCRAETGKWDFRLPPRAGGMPSVHTASICSLATYIGFIQGFSSIPFAIAVCFAGVVMYDSSGIRLAVSKHARAINLLSKDNNNQLNEGIGHRPIEVWLGCLSGVLGTIIFLIILNYFGVTLTK